MRAGSLTKRSVNRRMQQTEPGSRTQILSAARRVFAEKGFDGARVDAISAAAGVNKSLIYYYFKSKDEILSTIISEFFHYTREHTLEMMRGLSFTDERAVERLFEQVFAFLEEQSDLIRLIIMESLKKGSQLEGTVLFRFLDMYMGTGLEDVLHMAQQYDIEVKPKDDIGQIKVTEFFTMLAPVMLFIVLQDKWAEHYAVGKTELRRQFVTALQQTHIAYHNAQE